MPLEIRREWPASVRWQIGGDGIMRADQTPKQTNGALQKPDNLISYRHMVGPI
jgi:hypothetical protein